MNRALRFDVAADHARGPLPGKAARYVKRDGAVLRSCRFPALSPLRPRRREGRALADGDLRPHGHDMNEGIEIERRDCDGEPPLFLVWLISPMGHRVLFHETGTHAEALEYALEAVPIFGPLRRDDGTQTIQ